MSLHDQVVDEGLKRVLNTIFDPPEKFGGVAPNPKKKGPSFLQRVKRGAQQAAKAVKHGALSRSTPDADEESVSFHNRVVLEAKLRIKVKPKKKTLWQGVKSAAKAIAKAANIDDPGHPVSRFYKWSQQFEKSGSASKSREPSKTGIRIKMGGSAPTGAKDKPGGARVAFLKLKGETDRSLADRAKRSQAAQKAAQVGRPQKPQTPQAPQPPKPKIFGGPRRTR